MDTRKYIFDSNGVMKLNPAYQGQSTVQSPNQALAIVSSTQEFMQQSQLGNNMKISPETISTLSNMQSQQFQNKFNTSQQFDLGTNLDQLTEYFVKYEVPIGLINKLYTLSEYKLNMIIDDSGSMNDESDVPLTQATEYIRNRRMGNAVTRMTRWEEAEDRLHVMLDMLAHLPTDTIKIKFLNRQDEVILEHRGKTPDQFRQEAHAKILETFRIRPAGSTPIYSRLSRELNSVQGNTMFYLFTDGVPSHEGFAQDPVEQVKQLVLHRRNPQCNPITFMSCTNNDAEAQWMKDIEGEAPFTAELDDFMAEKKEVNEKQGPGFPFSKGFWLLCQMVAAINPDDLDALDEPYPFSKKTMDSLMGRQLTPQEYKHYFDLHPQKLKYDSYFQRFLNEPLTAKQILGIQQPIYSQNPNAYPNNPYGQSSYSQPQANIHGNQPGTQTSYGVSASNQNYQGYNAQPPAYNPYATPNNPNNFWNTTQQSQTQANSSYPQQPKPSAPPYKP